MNIPFFTSLFTKNDRVLSVPDSILIKKLKNLSTHSNLLVFKDVKIYHHTNSFHIPLMMFDEHRGLYLFETKSWSYDELKNATIQKAQNQDASKDTLAFDNTQNIIRQKFNELTHNDGVPIYNFLLMENLNSDEYEHLNDSFKELLPRDKVIFHDSNESEIFKKLQEVAKESSELPSVNIAMGTLLTQYAILDELNSVHLSTLEQRKFLDKELEEKTTYLNAVSASGKSSLLLLKAIVELFNKPSKKIVIIKLTNLACDILKRKLLNMVEHAIIDIDITSIEILTPLELLNAHQTKLGRELLTHINIDKKMMKKAFNIADIIMCDDSNLYQYTFIDYLIHIQKKSQLLLVNSNLSQEEDSLTKNFKEKERKVTFYKTNPHAKALQIIAKLLQSNAKDIVVVSNSLSKEKLLDDLESFISDNAKVLDSSINLIDQELNNLHLCTYADINAIYVKHIILMDLCFTSENQIEYAFNLPYLSVDVLYEEDCQEIKNLRNSYESSKE